MDSYNDILNRYSSDKGTAPTGNTELGNGYGDLYEKYFKDFGYNSKNICDIIFDMVNRNLPYSRVFSCENDYQVRSITSILIKND